MQVRLGKFGCISRWTKKTGGWYFFSSGNTWWNGGVKIGSPCRIIEKLWMKSNTTLIVKSFYHIWNRNYMRQFRIFVTNNATTLMKLFHNLRSNIYGSSEWTVVVLLPLQYLDVQYKHSSNLLCSNYSIHSLSSLLIDIKYSSHLKDLLTIHTMVQL